MALRAFHANPSIGGFGGENSTPNLLRPNRNGTKAYRLHSSSNSGQNVGDAFCQIVKELVDNALDAINSLLKNEEEEQEPGRNTARRIRVEIMPYRADITSRDDGTDDAESSEDLLRVSVMDNGCGMENIQECVNAFQSSKANSQTNSVHIDKHQNTSGRYGIGLTLCLLHAQRLVPFSCACITSSKKGWKHQARAFFTVDPEGDKVVCEKDEKIPKQDSADSFGTCVSLLIPGGTATSLTWSRLVAYFNRFKLCPDLSFGLEILAPTLDRLPIFILPRSPVLKSTVASEHSPVAAKKTRDRSPEKNELTVDSWRNIWSDDSGNESSNDGSESNSSELGVILPDLAAKTCSRRMELVEAAKAYLPNREIVLKNVAASIQKIRLSEDKNQEHTKDASSELQLEVNMVICPISAMHESLSDPYDEEEPDSYDDMQMMLSAEDRPATLELVRMVNDVPLLDGAEAHSCGLVHGLENKMVWGSFGLDISRKSVDHAQRGRCMWTPTFEVQDHNQAATYIQKKSNHKQLRALVENVSDESESEEDDFDYWNSQDSQARKRKRDPKHQQELLPAGLRLHEVLVVVRIRAAPSSLPLPTLSKGRLPLNHGPIRSALHQGLNDCLRSIQSTNTSMLLSQYNLQSMVRDIRYIPKLATEIALSVFESTNPIMQQRGKDILKLASKLDPASTNHRHRDDQSKSSSCDTNEINKGLDLSSLEKAIRQVLASKLDEKSKTMESSKKRMKKQAKVLQQRKDKSEDFKEIGCGEQDSKASKDEVPLARREKSNEDNSVTGSWIEFGDTSSSSGSLAQREENGSIDEENESVDKSPAPLKEVEFGSGKGVPVYESDDPFDDDWV